MVDVDKIEWLEVDSSNLSAVAYVDDETALYVKFKNDSVYVYKEVEYTKYADLVLAESKGKFLNEEIKGNYDYEKTE